MAGEYETVREVCAEMRDCANNETLGVESEREKSLSKFLHDIILEYAERAYAAHEREMAAIVRNLDALEAAVEENCDKTTVDKIITSKRHSQNSMAEKDAEIVKLVTKCNRLTEALKPVMEYDFGDYKTPWKTLEVDGEMMKGCVRCGDGYPLSIVDDIIFGIDALIEMANAIGEAQRIYRES